MFIKILELIASLLTLCGYTKRMYVKLKDKAQTKVEETKGFLPRLRQSVFQHYKSHQKLYRVLNVAGLAVLLLFVGIANDDSTSTSTEAPRVERAEKGQEALWDSKDVTPEPTPSGTPMESKEVCTAAEIKKMDGGAALTFCKCPKDPEKEKDCKDALKEHARKMLPASVVEKMYG